MSPRPRVRVADVDDGGRPINSYPGTRTAPTSGPEPVLPYAVHLTDRGGRFHLLAWDLDAGEHGQVVEDLAQLRSWLNAAAVPHLVCASSGVGESRHVWVRVRGDGVEAERVRQLTMAMSERLPTLDIAPLVNPAAGLVRPPGAPHRFGGRSRVLDGDLQVLIDPTTGADDIEALAALVGPSQRARHEALHGRAEDRRQAGRLPTVLDQDGRRRLAGPRRPLPPAARAALTQPSSTDPSAQTWKVLLGAVRSRWSLQDIAGLSARPADSPGLEHLRSRRLSPGRPERSPRGKADREQLLERQWAKAVRWVATQPDHLVPMDDSHGDNSDDNGYVARVAAMMQALEQLQIRADVSPGRWSRPGGAADRRVLDEVCRLAATAVRVDVAADIRSLSAVTGLSRETARYALTRLAADGWLTLHTPSIGPSAAVWALPTPALDDPYDSHNSRPDLADALESQLVADSHTNAEIDHSKLSTKDQYRGRSHVVPPPGRRPCPLPTPPLGTQAPRVLDQHKAWIHRLGNRLNVQAHDVFVGQSLGGLGQLAGRVYALLTTLGEAEGGPVLLEHLGALTGLPEVQLQRVLHELATCRLARPTLGRRRWSAGSSRHRSIAAATLGVRGTLVARRRTAAVDRDVWAWWQAELAWMHTPGRARRHLTRRARRRHRPGPGQPTLPLLIPALSLRLQLGPYPRHRITGQADHIAARTRLTSKMMPPAGLPR